MEFVKKKKLDFGTSVQQLSDIWCSRIICSLWQKEKILFYGDSEPNKQMCICTMLKEGTSPELDQVSIRWFKLET